MPPSIPKLSLRVRAPQHRSVVVLVALAIAVSALPALAASPEEARISETRAQLQSVRDELESARDEAEDHEIALAEADRQLEAAFDAVEAASQAVARQQEAVGDAEARLIAARADLAAQRELMGDRVARLYRHARPDDVIQVLGASTVTQAVQQSAYMNAIGREDRAAVETLANAERRVEAEEQALAAEEVAMARVLEEQEALLAEVEEMRNDQALVAAASADLVARLEARENHLEEEADSLARMVAEREAAAAAAAARAAQQEAAARQQTVSQTDDADGQSAASGAADGAEPQAAEGGAEDQAAEPATVAAPAPPLPSGGGFSWPASGSVTSEYGPRWGRLHAGIDIANGTGTPIAAARGGSVIHAGPYGGYGNLVLIAHSGGFVTAYAHLSEVAVSNGQSVSTGTYLGGMGCTGSCTGTHLHFEIRANGSAVNPRNYL